MPRPGPSDTIPALLTPGEAVLVPEVAEAVGRHNIETANQHAVAKRKGIVPLQGYSCGSSKVQGYANGTSDTNYSVATALPGVATKRAISRHEIRDDLSVKGQGFRGNINGSNRANSPAVTELSVGMAVPDSYEHIPGLNPRVAPLTLDSHEKYVDVPSVTPESSRQQMREIAKGEVSPEVYQQAIDSAINRQFSGKQPFSGSSDIVQGYANGTPDAQAPSAAPAPMPIKSATPVYQSGNSYSDKPNTINNSTGITTVGGGNNGQSIANQFTKIAPPMVGMPGVASGPANNDLAKQNLFARTNLDTAARLGKAGNLDAATGIMQDMNRVKPISADTENRISNLESSLKGNPAITQDMSIGGDQEKFTALANEYGVQGFDNGSSNVKEPKFKPGVSGFKPDASADYNGSFPAPEPAPAKVQAPKAAPRSAEPKFSPGVSDMQHSDIATKEAMRGPLTEPPVKAPAVAKSVRQVGGGASVGGFTPSAEEALGQRYNPAEAKAGGLGALPEAEKAIQQGLYEKTLAVPQTGPYSNVPPRPTIEAGRNLAPVTTRGIVPVGRSFHTVKEPAAQQFRPGPGGAPAGEYKVNFTTPTAEANRAYAQFEAENPTPKVSTPASLAAEELANPKPSGAWRPMSAGEAAKQAEQMAAEKAAAPSWEQGARQAKVPNLKGIVPVIGKTLNTVGSVLGAAKQFAQPSSVEVYAQKRAELGDPQAQKVVSEGGVNPILQRAKSAAGSAASQAEDVIAEGAKKGYAAAEKVTGGLLPSEADYEEFKQALPGNAASTKAAAPTQAPANKTPEAAQPAPEQTKQPEANPQPQQAFAPKEVENGQYRVDLDDKGQFIQSANKAGIERVAKGLRERGGIVKAASKPAGAASDFWVNQGYPGGAAQYKAEQEQKALQNVALNGGGTGNMSVSEFRRANVRQKAAQGILADRERAALQREQFAAENKKSEASLAATAAERAYQHSKDVKEEQRHSDEMEQRERIAGDRPVKIGEDIMATRDVPEYQARKAQEAKTQALAKYVKDNSGLFSGSAEDALIEGLIQHGDAEGDKLVALKAYLERADTPEEKAKYQRGIDQMVKPYRSALNG